MRCRFRSRHFAVDCAECLTGGICHSRRGMPVSRLRRRLPWLSYGHARGGGGSGTRSPRSSAMKQHSWLRVLRMTRNGGQSAAFEAGFDAARGEIIATIDADLQNDPEEIARLLPLLNGCDMITGWRRDRQDTRYRRWQSRMAN